MKLLFKIALLLFVLPLYAQKAKVYAVHDGDSYKVMFENSTEKRWIRVAAIDCPEVRSNIITKTQPYGRMVADSVRLLLKHKTVTIDSVDTDLYGRLVAKVQLDTVDVGKYIISKGWGHVAATYISNTKEYFDELNELQQKADQNRLGIWYYGEVIHPYIWRTIYRK